MSTRQGIEVKKHAYRQTQDGIVISFVMHPNDVSPELATAPLGTRYMAALVEIGDDEQPVIKPKEKFSLTQEAGMHCTWPRFWKFLSEQINNIQISSIEEAATIVRDECFVESRTAFDKDKDAAQRWIALRGKFKAWELVP